MFNYQQSTDSSGQSNQNNLNENLSSNQTSERALLCLGRLFDILGKPSWSNLEEAQSHVRFLMDYLECHSEMYNSSQGKIAKCIQNDHIGAEDLLKFIKDNIENFNKLDLLSKEVLENIQKGLAIYLRVSKLREQFVKTYGREAQKVVISPGRAEIIGCHTDYNNGFSLAAAIENTFIFLSSKRDDNKIFACSNGFGDKVIEFEISKDIEHDKENKWNDYLRGVVSELLKAGFEAEGSNILIDSDVPRSGGVSSSAGLELGVAYTVLPEKIIKDTLEFKKLIANICKSAENNYTNCPCGYLDQGSVALGGGDAFVFFDFMPKEDMPVSEVQQIPANLGEYEFIISVDPTVKRELGLSGYPARRKMCEESLPIWSKLLQREISSLRDVTVDDFNKYKDYFEPVMRSRIEHVIFENERVLQAREALQNNDIKTFGRLLTESGESGLKLYGLDENTPELTYLLAQSLTQEGVIGSRNMGGGFSAVIISLVKKSEIENFKKNLSFIYEKQYGEPLEFINFKAAKGSHILDTSFLPEDDSLQASGF